MGSGRVDSSFVAPWPLGTCGWMSVHRAPSLQEVRVYKGCVYKGCVYKGCVYQGCVYKGCVYKGCVYKSYVYKGCVYHAHLAPG